MSSSEKRRFTVITNHELEHKDEEKHWSYQTNPMRLKFMKFVNNEAGRKFSVEDLLKW